MAAASLARSPPKPRVELLPSQSEQVPGKVLEFVVASTSALHSMCQSWGLCDNCMGVSHVDYVTDVRVSVMWIMRQLYACESCGL